MQIADDTVVCAVLNVVALAEMSGPSCLSVVDRLFYKLLRTLSMVILTVGQEAYYCASLAANNANWTVSCVIAYV